MTTQKRKGSKNRRSKKYRGGNDSFDDSTSLSSSTSSSWGLMDTAEEAAVLEPYKKAKFWNKFAYGATLIGLATVIGIGVVTKMKK
jgi:hypothetical protein